MDGHCYAGSHCPRDGHDNGFGGVVTAAAVLLGDDLSLDRLLASAVPDEALAYAVVAEFGVQVTPPDTLDLGS